MGAVNGTRGGAGEVAARSHSSACASNRHVWFTNVYLNPSPTHHESRSGTARRVERPRSRALSRLLSGGCDHRQRRRRHTALWAMGAKADQVCGRVATKVQCLLREHGLVIGRGAIGAVSGPDGRPIPFSVTLFCHLWPSPIACVHFQRRSELAVGDAARTHFGLTTRQASVAALMAEGRTYREIVSALLSARNGWTRRGAGPRSPRTSPRSDGPTAHSPGSIARMRRGSRTGRGSASTR